MTRPAAVTQSAVLAWRRGKRRPRFVLVTSLETRRWVLPKGHIESGLSARESAIREAFEEAGIEGAVAALAIGSYGYVKTDGKGGGRHEVAVYPMAVSRVLRQWPEKNRRRRKWMTPEQAVAAVDERKLKKLIAKFAKTLEPDGAPAG